MSAILVTGGSGYIGSHTVVSLLQAGMTVVVLDNLCNCQPDVIDNIERITGRSVHFVLGDVRDRVLLGTIFEQYAIDAVMHFAGLKAVGESVTAPLEYFDHNVRGSIVLFEAMAKANVKKLIFSSSATVYGDAKTMPITEDAALQVLNPYGRSKLMVEDILRDLYRSDPQWRVVLLRYFNPVGAHASGLIGERPNGAPNNLMPFIAQVAAGVQSELLIFGDDYATSDGTGVRDYIHVQDLAQGHLAALEYVKRTPGIAAVNLGTGKGYSVLELLTTFEKVCQKTIPYRVVARRTGDIAVCYANPSLAKTLLNWQAEFGLEKMCLDAWRWQQTLLSE